MSPTFRGPSLPPSSENDGLLIHIDASGRPRRFRCI
jgi:hypothetical protein